MYRRLANSKSQERLATQTPYKSPRQKIISQQPIPTEYSQVSTQNIPTYSSRSSRRSSSFYDLICRKCYKTREIALNNSFTPHDSKPQKEKLNNSFIQANPYSFQDLMSRDYVKRNKDKINKRQNASDNAYRNLDKLKSNSKTPTESLQQRNQYTTYYGLDGEKDPRYQRLKDQYDMKENMIANNQKMWNNMDNPRKAIKDYYDKVIYDTPISEPKHVLDKRFQDNFREDLMKQIEEKKNKRDKEKQNQVDFERRANDAILKFNKENQNSLNRDKFDEEKRFRDDNELLAILKKEREENEKREQIEYERKLNKSVEDKFKKFDKKQHERKLREMDLMNKYLQFVRNEKNKKQQENDEEKKKWNNYSEEIIHKCKHGNDYLRCALCNNLYPKKNLIKVPRKAKLYKSNI